MKNKTVKATLKKLEKIEQTLENWIKPKLCIYNKRGEVWQESKEGEAYENRIAEKQLAQWEVSAAISKLTALIERLEKSGRLRKNYKKE